MPEKSSKTGRPFPWMCIECKAKEIYRQPTDYRTTLKHDGQNYDIHIPDLLLPTCRNCGAQSFAIGDDDRVYEDLRRQAHLLTPQEMQRERKSLGLSQKELAEQLGVAQETISRWETGGMIQTRAMDNLLRLFFHLQEARTFLRDNLFAEPA